MIRDLGLRLNTIGNLGDGWLNVGNLCIGYNGQNCSSFRVEIGDCLKSTPFTADDRTSTNDIYCTKINQVPRKLKES